MSRVKSVAETDGGRIVVEIMTGTGKAVHRLPKEQAVLLDRALDEVLDTKQEAVSEVVDS